MSNVDEWDGKVPGAFNLRDLGGNPVAGGTIAPVGCSACDLLHRVDAELGARWLHQNDVRTLIDLRTLGEREGDGFMAASEHLDCCTVACSTRCGAGRPRTPRRTTGSCATGPSRCMSASRTALPRCSATSPRRPPTCCSTARPARTAPACRSALLVLGATPEVIAADYARSTQAMAGIVGWYSLAGRRHPPRSRTRAADRRSGGNGRDDGGRRRGDRTSARLVRRVGA